MKEGMGVVEEGFRRLVSGELFWEAAVQGNRLVVRWGRDGGRGQTRVQTFTDEAAAQAELGRLEEKQKEKGYSGSDQEPR